MRSLKHPAFIPALLLLAGASYLLGPFLAAWLEIVAPPPVRQSAIAVGFIRFWLSPDHAAPELVLALLALLSVAYFVRVDRSPRTRGGKTLAFVPLIILPLLWAATSPLRSSVYGQKDEGSYVAAGWSRMMLAGGPSAIRAEALDLLESPEEDSLHTTIPAADVPPSMRKLGDRVSVQRAYGLVLVDIQRVAAGADGFGYMIHSGRTPLSLPWFFEFSSNLRIWKLADGIYFFEQ